jgi:protein-tyrosine-phosphatase
VTVSSAGTGAWDGAPASEGAYLVGLEHGLDLSGHRARLLTDDLVTQADHIFAMAEHHLTRLRELRAGPKATLLGTFAGRPEGEGDVGDPFGGDIETYRQAFDDLDELVRVAAGRLREAGGG